MSLLDLLYLEESQSETVISAVRKWCASYGCRISDDEGKKAVAVAVRLAKSADGGGQDFLATLSARMAELGTPQTVPAVLLVEDEPFIAIDMEETLKEAGFSVEVRTSCADTLTWLTAKTPAVAVLDLHLKDGKSTPIAALLQTRGIPIVFCSGSHPGDLPEEFEEASWVHKPFPDGKLVEAVSQTLQNRTSKQQVEKSA